ncbi:MAG TPA: mercury methylation corrinoid protein HgcA [Ruminiclostridium sp.]
MDENSKCDNQKECCFGEIPQVSTKLNIYDKIGSWKARWGINRMNYKINPGLYCVGNADKMSPILVTANYKLSFDMLRRELSGINAWILVLDTKGINVWCAAGKGTFGTEELVNRISMTNLSKVVDHKMVILPQLGAPGVSAHEVQKRSGFKVVFGPVRAVDIKAFIGAGMKATSEMRKVKFTVYDRLVLTPIELVGTFKVSLIVFGVLFILNLFASNTFGIVDFYGYIGALLVGCVIVPILLPWIPGKAFAWKGWLMGMLWAVGFNALNGGNLNQEYGLVRALAYMLILPSVSAFYAMNFTGASTYTSFSGVLKEMKTAVPAIIISTVIGGILLLLAAFIPNI